MPICTKEGLDIKPASAGTFNDNDEVFYCETTKEIFRDYEDYFRRIMLINATIWACEVTGQENLTYAEALRSERKAKKVSDSFKGFLRAPALIVVKAAQQSSSAHLYNIVYQFLKDRYFRGEVIDACVTKGGKYIECKVVEIVPPEDVPENGVFDPSSVKYKVQKVGSNNSDETWVVSNAEIRRRRHDLKHENLQFFLRDNTERIEGIIEPKQSVYEKYVIKPEITFESLYVGKLPPWEPCKPRKKVPEKEKKQETLSKYLVKKNGENQESQPNEKEIERMLKDRLEKMQKEKEERQAEQERKRLELHARVHQEFIRITTKCDDLEREDQKVLPLYKPVKTIIPTKYFGDFLTIQEFLHSYTQIQAPNPFKYKINFYEMCRAFTIREVAGPLSDILQLLLNTIFSLQAEEEEECKVDYVKNNNNKEPWDTIAHAVDTHLYVQKHYSRKLKDLPVDSLSVSEILRLHLLASGASTDERSERWRYNYRNGYCVTEDPGLELRLRQPHILRALKMYSFYQLPLCDILKVLQCLINQILTYNNTLNLIEERLETFNELRKKLRALLAAENKRSAYVISEKKRLAGELVLQSAEIEEAEQKRLFEEKINKQVEKMIIQDEHQKGKFASELSEIESNLFDHILHLGSDRAYRNYYIFESLCGIFIEHLPDSHDVCLDNPPKNNFRLANCPHNKRDLKILLLKQISQEEKEMAKRKLIVNVINGEADKENQAVISNGEIPRTNGMTANNTANGELKTPEPTAYELYMCTGDPHHCIVHDGKNPDRVRWSFIHTEQELDTLIDTLNPLGIREGALREQIVSLKSLILNHITKCPAELLTVEEKDSFKEKVISETNKKYQKSNFGYTIDTELNEVLYISLLEEILDFESHITSGNLGKLKLKDLDRWRTDLRNNSYNAQCQKLIYGLDEQTTTDPGEHLGDTLDIESEDSSDEGISVHSSPDLLKSVRILASALLQIEQGIEQRFLKEPFGVKNDKDIKDDDERLIKGKRNVKLWEMSLMISTSFSQVYLHKQILSNAVKWYRSSAHSKCTVCRRKGDADKMLLCDDCNAGTHMFCLEPKLTVVPKGNWYCQSCAEKRELAKKLRRKERRQKKIFSLMEDEDDVDSITGNEEQQFDKEAEEKEEVGTEEVFNEKREEPIKEDIKEDEMQSVDDDKICYICFYEDGDITCQKCRNWFHFQCIDLRREPRGGWECSTCKAKVPKKRKIEEDLDSISSEEIISKRPRRNATKKTANTNNRRSIRGSEDFPLNSSILYKFLDDIMKHKDAWPFIRPVSQHELSDYHEIITNPMDFAKIKSNLNMGRYKNNQDLMKDVELVFKNCDTYNTQGNDIYNAGASLEKFVIEKCKELSLPFTPSDMIAVSGK